MKNYLLALMATILLLPAPGTIQTSLVTLPSEAIIPANLAGAVSDLSLSTPLIGTVGASVVPLNLAGQVPETLSTPLLTTSAISQAETWINVGTEKIGTAYVDKDSIKKNGDTTFFTLKMDYADKGQNVEYAIAKMEVVCGTKSMRNTEVIAYDGENSADMEVAGTWEKIVPEDTMGSDILNFVCEKAK